MKFSEKIIFDWVFKRHENYFSHLIVLEIDFWIKRWGYSPRGAWGKCPYECPEDWSLKRASCSAKGWTGPAAVGGGRKSLPICTPDRRPLAFLPFCMFFRVLIEASSSLSCTHPIETWWPSSHPLRSHSTSSSTALKLFLNQNESSVPRDSWLPWSSWPHYSLGPGLHRWLLFFLLEGNSHFVLN